MGLLGDVNFCINSANVWQIVGYAFLIFKIIIPIFLIVWGMLDLGRAVVAAKYDEIKKESENGDLELQKQLDLLRKGILSLQKKEFFKECQALLEEDHELTLDEYQQCIEDHDAYNGLKGNHRGDSLFALVEEKAKHISDK